MLAAYPVAALRQMAAVCRHEGVVCFAGRVNESLKEQGEGLHQWNFMWLDNGDLVIWQPDNRAMSLRLALGDGVRINASGQDWCQVEVHHVRQSA
jgi:hypothetical protein